MIILGNEDFFGGSTELPPSDCLKTAADSDRTRFAANEPFCNGGSQIVSAETDR
jgi:hypothetical protein